MPITLPNLDDRTYDDLITEARSLIPAYAPDEWTNHNASDPGITLIELFAYLSEMLIYRLNRVTDANVRAFLKLIDGVEREPADKAKLLDEVREVVKDLRKAHRAVTGSDFEELVLAKFEEIARVRCVPRRNLTIDDSEMRSLDKPGRVSLIIVPKFDDDQTRVQPNPNLIQAVKEYLEPLRLLTTRVHVVGPRYVAVIVRLTLIIEPDAVAETVKDTAVKALNRFFHPLDGGHDGKGWPFGRNVYVSEIYELLDLLPGVDYVKRTLDEQTSKPLDELITNDPDRIKRNSQGDLIAIELLPDELVSANISKEFLNIPPGGEESKVQDDD